MSGENFRPDIDEYREDPRTELAEGLRDFVMQAIQQQKVIDSDERRTKTAGSLYKIDGGFIKVHLQAPAADHAFHSDESDENNHPDSSLPNIWILIPITRGEVEFELEDYVLAANAITVHVLPDEAEPLAFLSREDYLGPLVPAFTTADEMLAYTQPDEAEQTTSAASWKELLKNYDIRTIASTSVSHPDVA